MIKIEILCPACPSCMKVERMIKRVMENLEIEMKLRPEVTITHINEYRQFSKYSINVSKTPIVVINGNVEFAGSVPDIDLLRKKLSAIIMAG